MRRPRLARRVLGIERREGAGVVVLLDGEDGWRVRMCGLEMWSSSRMLW